MKDFLIIALLVVITMLVIYPLIYKDKDDHSGEIQRIEQKIENLGVQLDSIQMVRDTLIIRERTQIYNNYLERKNEIDNIYDFDLLLDYINRQFTSIDTIRFQFGKD